MPRCSRGQAGANWVTLTSNLRFRFGRSSSVSTAPPRARVVVPTKIVPSLSPYGGPGRSLPSLPPCVQRLCEATATLPLGRPRGRRLAAWARQRKDARRCVAPPSGIPGFGRESLAGLFGQVQPVAACYRTSLLSLSLPPRAPLPTTPDLDSFRLGPRAPGPSRAARREDERRAAEGGAVTAAAGQRGPQSLCVEQGAAERRGLGGQGTLGSGGVARSRSRLGFGDGWTDPSLSGSWCGQVSLVMGRVA